MLLTLVTLDGVHVQIDRELAVRTIPQIATMVGDVDDVGSSGIMVNVRSNVLRNVIIPYGLAHSNDDVEDEEDDVVEVSEADALLFDCGGDHEQRLDCLIALWWTGNMRMVRVMANIIAKSMSYIYTTEALAKMYGWVDVTQAEIDEFERTHADWDFYFPKDTVEGDQFFDNKLK